MKSLLIKCLAGGMVIISLCFSSISAAQEQTDAKPATQDTKEKATQKQEKKQRKNIYDEAADARKVINDALKRAKKENRRVLIQWGANWCGWCHLLHDTFEKDKDVSRKLMYEYDLVLIDVGRFDKNLDIAEEYKADLKANGVPYLTILDADGQVIANQETGSLESKIEGKTEHDPIRVFNFLSENQAPYLDAESILATAINQARKQNKMVFVHFGAPWCFWCHRFEDWMAEESVTKIFAKDFVSVKIDVDRTLKGKEVHERLTKGKGGGIPWFAILDSQGKAIADSYRMYGKNLGYPYTDQEIEVFTKLIKEVSKIIDAKDLGKLAKSLKKRGKSAKSP